MRELEGIPVSDDEVEALLVMGPSHEGALREVSATVETARGVGSTDGRERGVFLAEREPPRLGLQDELVEQEVGHLLETVGYDRSRQRELHDVAGFFPEPTQPTLRNDEAWLYPLLDRVRVHVELATYVVNEAQKLRQHALVVDGSRPLLVLDRPDGPL